MFYTINQSCTPSFPIGMVKTEPESLDKLRLTWEDERYWQLWIPFPFVAFQT